MHPSRSSRSVLCLAIVTVLLAAGWALPVAATEEDETDPWQVHHTVNATVHDNYAVVTVGATVEAQAPGPAFGFEVEVPDDAYVTGLTVIRNGTIHEADVEPREDARERYEEAEREGRSAAIVEEARDASTYTYDVNVEPGEKLRAELTYERYLVADGASYELGLTAPATPLGTDRGASFDVRLHHVEGLADVATEGALERVTADEGVHLVADVGPRGPGNATDVSVAYRVNASDPGGELLATVHDGTGYFAHRIQADDQTARLPVDLALVLDRSGSMSGAKIDQLQAASRQLVDHLDERDRLHVTTFAHHARSEWEELRSVDANVSEDAHAVIDALQAGGGTNIQEGIQHGFAPFDRASEADRVPVIAFLTDGKATSGVTGNERLRTLAQETNAAEAHVFALAFGERADWSLVHGLAQDADGYAERAPEGQGADVDLERFLTRLTSPVLTNVTVDYEHPSVTSWRLGAPVVFAGDELVHVGTFDANLTHLNATVRAEGVDRTVEADLSEPVPEIGPAYLPRLVDHQRVQQLEDRIDAEGGNETLEAQALELALRHGFVTERTSLVVDLPRTAPASPDANAASPRPDVDDLSDDVAHDGSAEQAADKAPVDEGADRTSSGFEETSRSLAEGDGEGKAGQPAETPALGAIAITVALAGSAVARTRRS